MTKIQEMVEYLRARMADGPTLVNIYKIHDEAMRLYNEERAEAKKNNKCNNCHGTGFIDDIDWTGEISAIPCPACINKEMTEKAR